MRLHSIAKLAILVLVILIVLNGGCNGSVVREAQAKEILIEFLQKVPAFYDFTFWDGKTLREDNNLSPIYQVCKKFP